MNRGQYDDLLAQAVETNNHLDEMRRALNRIDGRLKDGSELSPLTKNIVRAALLEILGEILADDGPDVSE